MFLVLTPGHCIPSRSIQIDGYSHIGTIIFQPPFHLEALTGAVKSIPESHVQPGEPWLHQHQERRWRSLQRICWGENWEVSPELNNDNSDEHDLPYSAEKTGPCLRGANGCLLHLRTKLMTALELFTCEQGIIPAPSHEARPCITIGCSSSRTRSGAAVRGTESHSRASLHARPSARCFLAHRSTLRRTPRRSHTR